MMSTSRLAPAAQWTIAGALAACLIAMGSLGGGESRSSRPDPPAVPVLLGHGADRLPSESPADWVRNAEYIVEVHVLGERALPVPAIDLQRGEGIILRELDLEVSAVVWAAPGTRVAPTALTWNAFGWHWKGDPLERRELGAYGAPRMEVGHNYLLALDLPRGLCGDAQSAAEAEQSEWLGLGGSSVVPIDDGIVGNGEFEGVDDGRVGDDSDRPGSVLALTRGKGIAHVEAILREAARTTSLSPGYRTCE